MTSQEGDAISKAQLDRLGSRLRNADEPADEDLLLLNRYRERFIGVERSVVERLRAISQYPVESRHKSVPSIVAKLRRRQPARLSAIQDMAGARIVVSGRVEQDRIVHALISNFSSATVDDKRDRPSFGYRAVHVVVSDPLPFEIPVRTVLEHEWAQVSERLADRYGFELKYGGGPEAVQRALAEYSETIALAGRLERVDAKLAAVESLRDELLEVGGRFTGRLAEFLKALRAE